MTRGGRAKDRDGPERRCIVSGVSGPVAPLIRFVLGPDGSVVPDLGEKLPGRGAWVTSDRAILEKAVKKRLFNRAFKGDVKVPEGLVDTIESLLTQRLVAIISLARKAGQAVTGAEKVRAHVQSGAAAVILQARDGSARGKTKIAPESLDLPRIGILTGAELGLAFGREFAIHAALDAGGFAQRALAEAGRLRGLRSAGDGQAGQGLAMHDAVRGSAVPAGDEDG